MADHPLELSGNGRSTQDLVADVDAIDVYNTLYSTPRASLQPPPASGKSGGGSLSRVEMVTLIMAVAALLIASLCLVVLVFKLDQLDGRVRAVEAHPLIEKFTGEDLDDLKQFLDDDLRVKIDEVISFANQTETALVGLEEHLKNLGKDQENTSDALHVMNVTLVSHGANIEKMGGDVADLDTEAAATKTRVEALEGTVTRKTDQLGARIASLEGEISALDTRIEEKMKPQERKFAELNRTMEADRDFTAQLKIRIDQNNETIHGNYDWTNNNLNDIMTTQAETTRKLQAANRTIGALNQTVEDERVNKSALWAAHRDLQLNVTRVTQRLDAFEVRIEGLQGVNEEVVMLNAGITNPENYITPHGWIKIQDRQKLDVLFDRSYQEYIDGFGDAGTGDFWVGLENLHLLTREGIWVLRLEVTEWTSGNDEFAQYSGFSIGDSDSSYVFNMDGEIVSKSSGFSENRMKESIGRPFVADGSPSSDPCYSSISGGWWYSGLCGDMRPNAAKCTGNNFTHCMKYATGEGISASRILIRMV